MSPNVLGGSTHGTSLRLVLKAQEDQVSSPESPTDMRMLESKSS